MTALLLLAGLASLAHAVDPAERPQTEGERFIAERVVESPTWANGYALVEGRDDYAVAMLSLTPNEEVAGEWVQGFEDEWELPEE